MGQESRVPDAGRQETGVDHPLAEWVLSRPLRPSTPGQEPVPGDDPVGSRGFDTRVVPDDPAALHATVLDVGTDARPSGDEAAVEEAVSRGAAITGCVWLTGGDDRASVLTRLEIAERLRRRTDALVVVAGPDALRTDLADGLVADRTHLVGDCR